MIRYLLKRFLSGLLLLLIFVSLLFFLIQILLPGDYVSQFSLSLTKEQSLELRQQLGLDLPIWQRYFLWLSNILRGNLGNSFTAFGVGEPVMDIIKSTLPVTLLIFGVGTICAFFLGFWLGKFAAWRGKGLFSGLATFFSVGFYTSFPPWLAFLVVEFVKWKYDAPIGLTIRPRLSGFRPEEIQVLEKLLIGLAVASLITLIVYLHVKRLSRRPLSSSVIFLLLAALWVGTWFALGIQTEVPKIFGLIALPTLIYTLLSFGEIMLIMRTTMVETIHEEYVQTARAKGLPDYKVRDRHAARNALLPVMSRLVISLPFLLTGMVMLEEVMNVQGIGTALFYAVGMQNVTLALGMLLVIGLISLVVRLALEILQVALDPRLRSAS